jgi:phosphate-selective porin
MYSAKPWYVLLIVCCIVPAPLALAQQSPAASEDEVAALRREVEELKAEIRKLQGAQAPPPAAAAPAAPPSPAAAQQAAATQAQVDKLQQQVNTLQTKANQPATAGWNGEHFFLRSTDGNFVLMPTGYVTAQYAVFGNDYAAPPNSFSIRAARIGFEGSYGKQLDYVLNLETTSTSTTSGSSGILRDAYMDFKPYSYFRIMAGQYKVPFSMEVGTADTALVFANRSIISVLYPDAGGSFRAPGADFHGDFNHQAIEYWIGAFNGQGLLASGTTNESEFVARMRFSPWRNSDIYLLKGLGFGGSYAHSESKGLAGELSFSGALNDNAYTFFPQYHINGNVERYNAFLSWLTGPFGLRAEYAHLQQNRDDIGSIAPGGIGFLGQPPVVGEGYYISTEYFLTGETDPYNAWPRVQHPVIGPGSPGESGAPGWGAWAVKFRYSHLSGSAPGNSCDATTIPACPITPVINPSQNDVTDQFTFGFNWYLNYWVVLKTDIDIDRLKDPSVQGILPRNYVVYLETLQFRF